MTDVDRIHERENRRVRRWAGVTVVMWALVAAYFAALGWGYLTYVHPALFVELSGDRVDPDRMRAILRALLYGVWALALWPLLIVLAGAATTVFILASRRATLRQIHEGLARVSRQLDGDRRGTS
ncbi:MAG: hypothetical protein R3F56_16680 [Planctomycetota bacterium]